MTGWFGIQIKWEFPCIFLGISMAHCIFIGTSGPSSSHHHPSPPKQRRRELCHGSVRHQGSAKRQPQHLRWKMGGPGSPFQSPILLLVGAFNQTVGMMKFPTEWKVIKFMFQTTNQVITQWYSIILLKDTVMLHKKYLKYYWMSYSNMIIIEGLLNQKLP